LLCFGCHLFRYIDFCIFYFCIFLFVLSISLTLFHSQSAAIQIALELCDAVTCDAAAVAASTGACVDSGAVLSFTIFFLYKIN
jgi:hypothetical protein